MIFHRSRIKPNVINKVVIDNHELTQVNSAKYLGVITDRKLNWIDLLVQNPLLTGVPESGTLFLINLIAMFRFHYSSVI